MKLEDLYNRLKDIDLGQELILIPDVFPDGNIHELLSEIIIKPEFKIQPDAVLSHIQQDHIVLVGSTTALELVSQVQLIFTESNDVLYCDASFIFSSSWELAGPSWFKFENPRYEFILSNVDYPLTGRVGGNIDLGVPAELFFQVPTNIAWLWSCTFEAPYPGISTFFHLIGGDDLTQAYPAPISTFADIGVSEIDIEYNSQLERLSFVKFTLSTNEPWNINPGLLPGPGLQISSVNIGCKVNLAPTSALGDQNRYQFSISGLLNLGGKLNLVVEASQQSGGGWVIGCFSPENESISLTDIASLFTGDSASIPSQLQQVAFAGIGLSISTSTSQVRFTAHSAHVWQLTEQFSVQNFQVDLTRDSSAANPISGHFSCSFDIKDTEIRLFAELSNSVVDSWNFAGTVDFGDSLSFGDFIQDLSSKFNIASDLQTVIADFKIKKISVTFHTLTKDFSFICEGALEQPAVMGAIITLQLTKSANGNYQNYFSGQITIGDRQFDLIFDSDNDSKILIALYQKPGGEQVSLSGLLSGILPGAPIPDLNFAFKNALLVLDREQEEEVEGETATTTVNKYLFTTDMDLGINLAGLGDLPIIGPKLAGDPLTLSLQPLLSSSGVNALTDPNLDAIRLLLPDGSSSLPETLGDGGVGLVTTLRWGSFEKVFELGVPPNKIDPDPGLPANNPIPALEGETSVPGETQTKDVNQHFGALNIAKVSMSYQDEAIQIGLDGEVSIGPLSMALMGLGASFNVSTKELGFKLDGLALAYSKPPLEISGAFLHMGDQLVGEATVRAAAFGLSAIGAFSTLENGKPSLFIYAFLDFPLGGPSFFFVDGLALGFGYNRNLEIPPIEELRSFPLIAEVIGEAPSSDAPIPAGASASSSGSNDLLTQLEAKFQSLVKYITPMEGQYFLAVGIRFNSFKTIESFALLTVSFGHRLELAIMGFSKLTVPAKPPGAESFTPVAEIEMVFSVIFSPEEGSVKVQAYLTPSSYLLSGLCKLEGGFAFFTWFKGEHAEDFVVTLGGYHPKFQIPAHYPQPISVPRLAFTWKVSDLLSLKGTAYFALTPKAMMVGVGLEAKLKVGAEDEFIYVEADFKAAADFLVYWKPFHYEATASIEINATITLNLDLFSVSDDISAGADLQLWGPPFAGTADVHAKVLGYKANFTFDFGADKKLPMPLTWDQFQESFLPAEPAKLAPSLSIERGLVKQINDLWVVNPKDLHMGISTIAPLTEAYSENDFSTDETGSGLHVEPMFDKRTLAGGEITNSQLVIQITSNGENKIDDFRIVAVQKKFPSALWTDRPGSGSSPNINDQALISKVGGYRVSPKKPPTVDSSHDFLVSVLSFEKGEDMQPASFDNELTFSASDPGLLSQEMINNSSQERASFFEFLGIDPLTNLVIRPDLADSLVITPRAIEITLPSET